MADHAADQRLAAILFADIAGYTQLMQADEAGTYAAWRAGRTEGIEPIVAAHFGRVVKFTGDGFLAEFPSAEQAVLAALAVQTDFARRAPLRLRIGIHLGDVYAEGGDVYGDGVNLASRLEGLAEPGSICISGTVHDLVRRKIALPFRDGGRQSLKHIAEPVQVWHLLTSGPVQAPAAQSPVAAPVEIADSFVATLIRSIRETARRPGIAVLPFENLSSEPDRQYFAEGLAEDLVTDLSRTGALFVVPRSATAKYRDTSVDPMTAANELGVRYVLTGSVRRAGEQVRIAVQLVDATTGAHGWADRYDRSITDIFAVQDEIAHDIVVTLSVALMPGAGRIRPGRGTRSIEAFDLFLKARDHMFQFVRANNRDAGDLARRVVEIDPGFAAGHALVANIHMIDWLNQWTDDPERDERLAIEACDRAIRANPVEPFGHWVSASIVSWQRDYPKAMAIGQHAFELDPTFVVAIPTIGNTLLGLDRPAEALAIFDAVSEAMPMLPRPIHFRARALFHLGRYADAAGALRGRIAVSPETDVSRALLAASYGHLGMMAEARKAWQDLRTTTPGYRLSSRQRTLPEREYGLMLEGLTRAGIETSSA